MNFRELAAILAQIRKRVENSQPAFRVISDLMVSSAQQNFETEGRPNKWAPLKPATQAFKLKHGWTKILMRSGQLRARITGASNGTSAVAGSNLVYAAIQNDGGVINHPNKGGSAIFKYNKRTGMMLGFASRKEAMKDRSPKSRIGFMERQFTGHSMATAITMPARPFLIIQPEDVERYNTILHAYWFTGRIAQ